MTKARQLLLSVFSLLLATTLSAQIYDNGPIINSPGTGAGGADESVLQTTSLGMTTLGLGHQVGAGNTIVDDFEVPEGEMWTIDEVMLYAYQTGSSTTSTITAIHVRIWDGEPGNGGAVIFGDLATNRMTGTTWSNVYRVTEESTGTATNRPVMENTATVGVTLEEGVYWLEWQADGTLGSGPWAPPITINGQTTTGNGLQSLDNGVTWGAALDGGTATPQGFPFQFFGEIEVPTTQSGQVVNLAAITNVNVTLDDECGATLVPSQIFAGNFDVDGDGLVPDPELYNIVVEDNDPSNGPIIDGCGTWTWTAVNNSPDTVFSGFTSAWGFVNAEDKIAPVVNRLPTPADELFCVDIDQVNINLLPANVSRCWTQDGETAVTLLNSMSPQLRARLIAGGDGSFYTDNGGNSIPDGIPYFFDGCSNVEICVNDIVTSNDPCEDVVITRVFTATDGDCPTASGEANPPTVISYDIIFSRPSISEVSGVDSLASFSCDENPPLLPPNAFGDANPAPVASDFPYITLASGSRVYLSAEGFCNIGATFQDGPRIVTCDQTYKFVRTFTVIDWCEVDSIRTFTQLVKVGDFEAPVIDAPTQDLDFNGVPDDGPLFFSTNTADCEAIFAIPAGSASDNCDPNPSVTAVIYPFGDTQALGFGPYSVGELTLAGNGGIPAGQHVIRYTAVDDCGNPSSIDVDLLIGDETAPVAICEDGLNVSIGGPIGATGGVAQLCADDVNAASYDDCSDIDLTIRITHVNGVALSPFDPLYQFQECHTLTCDQLGTVRVDLRVIDDANGDGYYVSGEDNENFCWLDILVEDKTAPICIPPAPVTVTCADLAQDFPQDLNVEFVNDPEGTKALLDAQFGAATGLDNCPNPDVDQTVFDDRNSCGVGTIQRTFTVTDAEGFMSPPNCAQLITVIGIHDYTIVFPGDQESDDCFQPDYNGVTFTEYGCDLITVAVDIDTFTATADECYKLRVFYEVLNWCEYNTLDDAYAIPRDADGDNILTNDSTVVYVDPRGPGLEDDIAYLDRDVNRNNFNGIGPLDTGDGGVVDGTNVEGYGQDGSRGAYTYIQFVKIYDDTPPALVIPTPEDICSYDGVNCDADVELGFSISDDCSPASVNATVELDAFINPGADLIYTLADFVADGGNVTDAVTNNGDGTFTINLPNIPIGRHALRIRATDGCGNTAIDLLEFEVVDCKAPTPICINGLTVTLMPDGEGGGMADIWVSDFIASPSTDCSGPVKFAIYTNDYVLDQGADFVPNPLDTGLVLTCDSDETTMVRIYAIDAMGQFDYCLTTLLVQENTPGICPGGGSFNDLAGVIMTEAAGTVPGVDVAISGNMSASTTTNAQGIYNFSDLATGEDYTITPEFDSYEYHLTGVSTFDLVLISKHILGIDELTSPYSLLAADANADENVSVQDIIAIRRLILGLDLTYTNSPAWMFVDAQFDFPVTANPWATSFPEVFSVNNINQNVLNADFVAVMIGNVDGNGMANLAGGVEGRSNESINVEDVTLQPNAETSVAITFDGGFQGTLALTPGVEVVNVVAADANSTAFNLEHAATGLVAFSDMSGAGFELVLRSATEVQLSEVLTVSDRITTTEGYLGDEAFDLNLDFTTQEVVGFELLQNAPNPVADVTIIGFNLPVAVDYSITVQDVTGKVVLNTTAEGVAGYNSVNITRAELGATGVLTYTLVAGDFTATKKMVVVK